MVVGPGAAWSVSDVEAGLLAGLEAAGVSVVRYRMDVRIARAASWLHFSYRKARKTNPEIPRPTDADVVYQAGADACTAALRHRVDAVIVVSGMYLHPDVAVLFREARKPVALLCTESPYDTGAEVRLASLVDGVWTNERTCVEAFRRVLPRAAYLPAGWHPTRHRADRPVPDGTPAHDVVFVGSGFPERIRWFESIDWTGIDLGLYGNFGGVSASSPIRRFVRAGVTDNQAAAALYRRAAIGLNLYRAPSTTFAASVPGLVLPPPESLSPRAYELAALGVFHLSEPRAEVAERFGSLVPTFTTPAEAEGLIRRWLPDAEARAAVARELPACVAESSYLHRAVTVIGDLHELIAARRAA